MLSLILPFGAVAQMRTEVPPPNYIRTVLFNGQEEFSGTPVILLGEGFVLEFDDIIGDEANYFYSIKHYNYDWTPSELVKSEYLEGFDDVRIKNYKNSFNTLQLYTHYKLNIPNQDTRRIKVSGNYIISIFNENKELVFSRKFMVYEPFATVAVEIKRPRDVKLIEHQQVVNFTVSTPDLVLKNPQVNVKVVIMQNNNLKTAIYNIEPQYAIGNELIYKYDKKTSFWAGNEYLAFDSKSLRAPTVNIHKIEVLDLYHHYLYPNDVRALEPYTYNPDINGNFVIRSLQSSNVAIEADYIWTHFFLQTFEPVEEGEVHLYGSFNNYVLDETTLMEYNTRTGFYENARLFKQGFYNYKYVLLLENGVLDEGFFSGNFAKTENEYTVLVYYRSPSARYDHLIGVGSGSSLDISI